MRRPDIIHDINIECNCQLGLINKGWMLASDRVYIYITRAGRWNHAINIELYIYIEYVSL